MTDAAATKKKPVKPVLIALAVVYLIFWVFCFLAYGRGYDPRVASGETYKKIQKEKVIELGIRLPGVEWWPNLSILEQRRAEALAAGHNNAHAVREFRREIENWVLELGDEELHEVGVAAKKAVETPTSEEFLRYRTRFAKFDANSDGQLSAREASSVLEQAFEEGGPQSIAIDEAVRTSLLDISAWTERRIAEANYAKTMTWFNVGMVVFIIWYFGWGALLGFLANRSKEIEREINEAQSARESNQSEFLEIRRKLENFDKEKAKIDADAEAMGGKEEARVAAETELVRSRLQKAEEEQLQLEYLRAKQELRTLIIHRSIEEAESAIAAHVTTEDRHRHIENFIDELDVYRPYFEQAEAKS